MLTGPIFKYLSGALGIGVFVLAIYVLILRGTVADLEEDKANLTAWQDNAVTAVQTASGNSETTKDTAIVQINELGTSLVTLTDAIEDQNEAIDQLAWEREQAIHLANVERQRRLTAVREARERIEDFEARALVPAEDTEMAVREAQDQAFEGGH